MSKSGKYIRFKLFYNRHFDEYQVKVFVDGRYDEAKSYFTDDKQDAIDTRNAMVIEYTNKGYQLQIVFGLDCLSDKACNTLSTCKAKPLTN